MCVCVCVLLKAVDKSVFRRHGEDSKRIVGAAQARKMRGIESLSRQRKREREREVSKSCLHSQSTEAGVRPPFPSACVDVRFVIWLDL